ncbi:condensation domain-containing protein [Pseudomonas aeruginosa]|nr:condensation domain-containing protein [Pseudomonas aeruginosa]
MFSYDRFTGEVDTQALERALPQAARDTEAFRLRLGETDVPPYQWLDADAEFEARHVDLRADRDPEAAVRSWLRDAFRHAYPLDGRSLVDLACCSDRGALRLRAHPPYRQRRLGPAAIPQPGARRLPGRS